jgi:hypothetical protein
MSGPADPNRILMRAPPSSVPAETKAYRTARKCRDACVETAQGPLARAVFECARIERRPVVIDLLYLLLGIAIFAAFVGYAALLKKA